MKHLRIIAIASQKGGVGKTSTAVNLSAALAESGRKVLLIDLDAQANATTHLGVNYSGKGILETVVYEGNPVNLVDLVNPVNIENLDIIPSSDWLGAAEKILATEAGAETILRAGIASLPADRWDYIMLDCPPSLGVLTINGLVAAREVLVPVAGHYLAVKGLAQLLLTVQKVKERLNPALEITGILPCRISGRTAHAKEVIERLRERFGDLVFDTVIRENIRIAEAPGFGQPITSYDSRSAGAIDYRALAAEVIRQEGERK